MVASVRPGHFLANHSKEAAMEELTWIGILLGLFAVTLLYVRLCENA